MNKFSKEHVLRTAGNTAMDADKHEENNDVKIVKKQKTMTSN